MSKLEYVKDLVSGDKFTMSNDGYQTVYVVDYVDTVSGVTGIAYHLEGETYPEVVYKAARTLVRKF